MPRDRAGEGHVEADRDYRRAPHPLRIRLHGPQGRGVPHLPCANGAPVPAGGHDLRHQQGCHFTDSIRIRLGRMRTRFDPGQPLPNEEMLYCNSCRRVPTVDAQFLSPDSAAGLLRPASKQCFGVTRCKRSWRRSIRPRIRTVEAAACATTRTPTSSRRTRSRPAPTPSVTARGGTCLSMWGTRTVRWRNGVRPATCRTRPGWTRAIAWDAIGWFGKQEPATDSAPALRHHSRPSRELLAGGAGSGQGTGRQTA